MNTIISVCTDDVKFEWSPAKQISRFTIKLLKRKDNTIYHKITYRLCLHDNEGQMMIPDLAIFITPLSTVNFELCVIEVKKHGNFSNGGFENDAVKLGKEMKLALDKLIMYKVDSPEVIGLLVNGGKVTVMNPRIRLNPRYNGQYRLIEISSFFIPRDTIDDIMLVPCIMQKLGQVQQIIQDNIDKLYKAIRKEVCCNEDDIKFIRKVCQSPVTVKKD